ncbi:MAG TPA: trypsin-like peptidase domain-containing protein [Bryobacteraceae bacterium]|nr:trypsin-like peptidase domain-containing protein [Bryobacteraceae bacterium]
MMRHIGAGLAILLIIFRSGSAQTERPRNPLAQLSESIRELTNRIAPAVVEISVTAYAAAENDSARVSQISRQHSTGSGVIVDPSGYIMSNAHVVRGAIGIKVVTGVRESPGSQQTSRTFDARILGMDTESDLALLRIDASELPVLQFGDSDKLRQGDLVLAVGSPLGLRNSVSMGVVSAVARAINDENPILYIQTDASINPGNSGGALVDTDGSLVGLNTFIVSQSGGNEGIGFAIPSNVVRNVYQQLRRKGRVARGSLGLFVQNITRVLAKGLGLPLSQGVVVADVQPDGPADRVGVKRKDIILSVNGTAIETARQFDDAIYRRQGGESVALSIRRGDETLPITAEVREESAPQDSLAALTSPEKNLVPRLGIFCIEIDKEVAQMMPDLRRTWGLIVAAKSPEGQAQFIDLQPGDVIHSLNNLMMTSVAALRSSMEGFQHGDAIVLQVERDGRLRYVAFELE